MFLNTNVFHFVIIATELDNDLIAQVTWTSTYIKLADQCLVFYMPRTKEKKESEKKT